MVPKINFKAKLHFEMEDLDIGEKMELLLTKELSDEEINSAVDNPLILPAYPCHTQSVERVVGLVSEAAKHRVGFDNRHRLIYINMYRYIYIDSYLYIQVDPEHSDFT